MKCPACEGDHTELFYKRDAVPVHSCLLVDSEQQARDFPQGDLAIALCADCSFIFNHAYDPAKSNYSPDYEETQGYSPHFQAFLSGLADRWVKRYDLLGGRVLEIGCGKGEFLVELVRHGVAEAVGVDPGVHAERIPHDVRERVDLIAGFFPGDWPEIDADAVVCRHTLEHVGPVAEFMRQIRTAIGNRTETAVLFELPDTLRVLREAAFWDVYYEHCSYFTLGSLERLFRRTGFEVLDLSMAYDDQYLLVEARPIRADAGPERAQSTVNDSEAVMKAVRSFTVSESRLVDTWSDEIAKVSAHAGRVVIWGSGSKGVAFLAALGDQSASVGYAVDINPHKHGKFMAGTGHQIVAPEFLKEYQPELVIAMNPVYLDEIRSELTRLDVSSTLKAL